MFRTLIFYGSPCNFLSEFPRQGCYKHEGRCAWAVEAYCPLQPIQQQAQILSVAPDTSRLTTVGRDTAQAVTCRILI